MKHGYYDFRAGKWIPIKCPICGDEDYEYESYNTEFWGAIVTAEQHGYCRKCGYTIEQAYSRPVEFFDDIKRGYKDLSGVYHEKNYKRHKRVRRKHWDKAKLVDNRNNYLSKFL